MQARSEDSPQYLVDSTTKLTDSEDAIIERALAILAKRVRTTPLFDSPRDVKEYVQLRLAHLEHEVFVILTLDAQHRLIKFTELFRGTLTATSVYPREVVKLCLQHNAGAVILAHNHPSGAIEPSRADEHLTQTLKTTLALIDVRVLDHLVVSNSGCTSFAERGLL